MIDPKLLRSTPEAVARNLARRGFVLDVQAYNELEAKRRHWQLESDRLHGAGADAAAAKLILEDGSEYPEPGKLLFSEVTVNQGTDSVTLRAEFPNPRRELLPGMFVHARLECTDSGRNASRSWCW